MNNATSISLRSPADLVLAVPYLVGFHPVRSLVLLVPGAETFIARFDLPPAERAPAVARMVLALITDRDAECAALVGYGTDAEVEPLMRETLDGVAALGIELWDAVRVDGGRFWSYLCGDPGCCPPEGREQPADGAVTAAVRAAGLVALDGRDALARSIAAVGGEAMAEATKRAELTFLTWVKDDPDGVRDRMVAEGLPLVRRLVAAAEGGALPTDEDAAWLGILLTHLHVRDEAWVRIDADPGDAHVRLWSDVIRRVEDSYAAGPACLLAFAAWRTGDGALANVALDRSVAADPAYTMAGLLRDVIDSGLPPWSLPPPMTPEELEREWCAQEARA